MTRDGRLARVVVLGAGFGALAVLIALVRGPLPGDRGGEQAIQNALGQPPVPAGLIEPFLSLVPPLLVGAAIAARQRLRLGVGVVAAVLGVDVVGGLVEIVIGRPRPAESGVRVFAAFGGPGFPSVSVASSVFLAGIVWLIARRLDGPLAGRLGRVAFAAAATIAVVLSLEVIDLGAHWPTDVLGGWLFGGLGIAVVSAVGPLGSANAGRA